MKAKLIGGTLVLAAGGTLLVASPVLEDLLARWEGRVLTVYADRLARGLPTVCKGLTRHITETPIVVGERWSADKCAAEERRALTKVQLELIQCFDRVPTQGVFDAATSHAWNNGVPDTCGSAAMKAWNKGDWMLGCRRLAYSDAGKPVWSYVKTGRLINGKPEYQFVRGLHNRRVSERAICEGRA